MLAIAAGSDARGTVPIHQARLRIFRSEFSRPLAASLGPVGRGEMRREE